MRVFLSRKARTDLLELDEKVRSEDRRTVDWLMGWLLDGIDGALARDVTLVKQGVRSLVREGFVIFYRPVGRSLRVMRVLRGQRHWRHVFEE